MKTKQAFRCIALVAMSHFFSGSLSANVTDEDFKANTTRNLINLCTASENDPHSAQAIHFCHGYLVGAYQYNESIDVDGKSPKFCFPVPNPTRNEAISMFVTWALNHPQYMNELPVNTEFRFLMAAFPCKQK